MNRNGLDRRLMMTALLVAAAVAITSDAAAQTEVRAVFVANNGNLEGSVTSFAVNDDGTLTFVNRVITGTRPVLSDPCAGCNAYEISITPDGRFLASAHAAGDLDGITILSVGPTAFITQVLQLPLPAGQGTPLDVVWLDNQYLAVTRTDTSPDQIVVYRFDPAGPSLTQAQPPLSVGTNSMGYLAMHPRLPVLYANDSSAAHLVRAYQVGDGGALALIDSESVGTPFPLELTLTVDGARLYAAGGISDGGNKVPALVVAADGTLSPMPGSPFVSQGSSPSNVYPTGDGQFLVVGHGTDATARTMHVDPRTGALTPTGFSFDVGLQGTLGDVHTMGRRTFVTDNSTATDGLMGIYAFTIAPDGALNPNGPIVSTGGIAPRSIARWVPADFDHNGIVNGIDLATMLGQWTGAASYRPCPTYVPSDLNKDCKVNGLDLATLLGHWG